MFRKSPLFFSAVIIPFLMIFSGTRNNGLIPGAIETNPVQQEVRLTPVSPESLDEAAGCAVSLYSPGNGQYQPQFEMPNGKYQSQWEFKWYPCSGATSYHLYVIGPNAQNPVVDNPNIRGTSFKHRSEHYGITETMGWKWYVRAFSHGSWGPWSEVRTFNVAPKGSASITPVPGVCNVQLASPGNNARLTKRRGNGGKYYSNWTFSWRGCPNASAYQLYVIGPGAQNPIINVKDYRGTSYTYRSSDYGAVRTENWKWQVRAKVNGKWGQWSRARYFDIALR